MPHGHGPNRGGGRSFTSGFDDPFSDTGQRLSGLLEQEFVPELARSRRRRGASEERLTQFLDPERGERSVTEGANRIASDVLRPGGEIADSIRRLRGGSIRSGFGTQGGDTSRQESQIISRGLRSSVGSFIGQSLPGLFEGAATRTANLQREDADRAQGGLESLFTGLGSAESLRLASRRQKIFGIF